MKLTIMLESAHELISFSFEYFINIRKWTLPYSSIYIAYVGNFLSKSVKDSGGKGENLSFITAEDKKQATCKWSKSLSFTLANLLIIFFVSVLELPPWPITAMGAVPFSDINYS